MSYTSHGHHIPGTIKGEGTVGPVARCGGINVCQRCKSEVDTSFAMIHGDSNDYQAMAKKITSKVIDKRLRAQANVGEPPEYSIYVVWSSKTLQNWKAMVSTTLYDGLYYEVTHDGDKNLTYVDTYQKIRQDIIED